jgi:hypothetical protein
MDFSETSRQAGLLCIQVFLGYNELHIFEDHFLSKSTTQPITSNSELLYVLNQTNSKENYIFCVDCSNYEINYVDSYVII